MADKLEITMIGGDAFVRKAREKYGRRRVNGVVKKNASDLQRDMMRKAPVDTGTMKRSIAIDLQPALLSATVGPGVDYAPYVEYGTRFMGAQPFVRPARDAQMPIFLKDMRDLMK